jgi:hypothetical protein
LKGRGFSRAVWGYMNMGLQPPREQPLPKKSIYETGSKDPGGFPRAKAAIVHRDTLVRFLAESHTFVPNAKPSPPALG